MATNQPAPTPSSSFAALIPAGATAQNPLPLQSSTARIGQGPQNDLVLDDDTVSTSHARIDYSDGSWQLTDLGSRNGTFVDGQRLPPNTPTALREGALIAFGGLKMTFTASAPAGAVPQAPPQPPPRVEPAPPPLAQRQRFRLPVWVVLLIIVLIAVAILIAMTLGGSPEPIETYAAMLGLLVFPGENEPDRGVRESTTHAPPAD